MKKILFLILFLLLTIFGWLFCERGTYLGPFVVILFLTTVALYDALQKRHTILRNFPIIGHFRYFLEMIRPEIQQYFIESNTDGRPLPRNFRARVYSSAKNQLETVPFGTELDVYDTTYRWVNHSSFPVETKKSDLRVQIGNEQCSQPYSASLFNISAMSYGSLSHAAVSALGQGAKKGNFYHNTGEGGASPYHLKTGADIVWQIGTAYFGCRDKNGFFDAKLFQETAIHPNIKMIEIKISQGAKPGHGGVLPGEKVNNEIAQIRKVEVGKTVYSPPGHTAFTNPDELCEFITQLRFLSGGKPVGFKLCIGKREEFIKICESMVKNKVYPDFITVDGGEGGTGAAPFDFINYIGSPLNEALFFVNSVLIQYKIREHIKLIASGKVLSGFNLFEKLALGADLCNSARGMMLALGCIQAYRCNTNSCPTGITTNDKALVSGLNIPDKAQRVANFHKKIISDLSDILVATGLNSPRQADLNHISCRWNGKVMTLAEMYKNLDVLTDYEKNVMNHEVQGVPKNPVPPKI